MAVFQIKGAFLNATKAAMFLFQVIFQILKRIPLIGTFVDLFTLMEAVAFNFGSGNTLASGTEAKKPKLPLKLYSFVACPFCRKVDETVSTLGLDCIYYPCPKVSLKKITDQSQSRYRPEAIKIGGKTQFPLLVDDNTKTVMYESEDIMKYLWKTYGDEESKPFNYRVSQKIQAGNFLRAMFRPLNEHGMLKIPSKKPKELLVLWGYEGSPFVLRVREVLCSLELPYLYKTVPHGAKAKRVEFLSKHSNLVSATRKSLNLIIVPTLEDPNTGVNMCESADIVEYLLKTYKTGEIADETMLDFLADEKKSS